MKIAYLISAYTDPIQLGNMIDRLTGDEKYFFIHLDKRVEKAPFEDVVSTKKNTTIIDKRILVQWGGFGQVLYQKAMLEAAIHAGIDFDRVFILTAQDYPVISPVKIEQELATNPNKEYIIGVNITQSNNPNQLKNICWYHLFRDLPVHSYLLKKAFSGGARIIMRCLPIRKKPYLTINNHKWEIFKSSSYMCITFACAKFIYGQLCSNKTLMNYFKSSYIPEEMVIPTILFNSSYAAHATLTNNSDNLQAISAITFFHYDSAIKIFTETDYNELMQCGKMFARKFSSKSSKSLMNKIIANGEKLL